MPDLNLSDLDQVSRLLLTVPLKPVQGERFQPPVSRASAATYQTKDGPKLLVESAKYGQPVGNDLRDLGQNQPIAALTESAMLP